MFQHTFSSLRKSGTVILALAFGTLALGQQRDYSFDESTSEALTKYKAEADKGSKDYDLLIGILEAQMAKLKDKTSYDYAKLLLYRAFILLDKNQPGKALESMEQGLLLSDAKNPTYYDEREMTTIIYYLSVLYFQEATAPGKKIKDNLPLFDKSEHYIDRWTKMVPKPTEDQLMFHVSLLYTRATADEANIDKKRISRALDIVNQAMQISTRPKENLYVMKLACYQQLDRLAESAEIFEVLLRAKPENASYWKQLAATYQQLNLPVRVINTLEKAQSYGLLTTPADNYNIVGTYYNEGQFEKTAELLEKWLKNGGIESTQKNWELLAFCYQQLNRDFKAIDALKRGSVIFPKSGQFDYMIAQIYFSMQKQEEAMTHLSISASKGGGTRPHQTYLLLAFIAYDLKKYDEAMAAAEKASTYPESAKEGQRMKRAVQDAVEERAEKVKNTKF